jgi:hypothetical protein
VSLRLYLKPVSHDRARRRTHHRSVCELPGASTLVGAPSRLAADHPLPRLFGGRRSRVVTIPETANVEAHASATLHRDAVAWYLGVLRNSLQLDGVAGLWARASIQSPSGGPDCPPRGTTSFGGRGCSGFRCRAPAEGARKQLTTLLRLLLPLNDKV